MRVIVPDLKFQVEGAAAVPYAAVPTLAFKLRIAATAAEESIHSILLRCQIQIEAPRRRYGEAEQRRLFDLFGEPRDWGRTLRSMPWTQVNLSVPGFVGSTLIDLPVPCTYDFNVAATKYFDALEEGDVPLCLLFSGTVFYAAEQRPVQVAQIPWEKEATFRFPVRVWREMMDQYYPNCVWIALRRDLFDRLAEYQSRCAAPTWERALEALLDREMSAADEEMRG
jgi:hypothetical protein